MRLENVSSIPLCAPVSVQYIIAITILKNKKVDSQRPAVPPGVGTGTW